MTTIFHILIRKYQILNTIDQLLKISNFILFFFHNINEQTHANILVSAYECQVSWGDTNGEVVDN